MIFSSSVFSSLLPHREFFVTFGPLGSSSYPISLWSLHSRDETHELRRDITLVIVARISVIVYIQAFPRIYIPYFYIIHLRAYTWIFMLAYPLMTLRFLRPRIPSPSCDTKWCISFRSSTFYFTKTCPNDFYQFIERIKNNSIKTYSRKNVQFSRLINPKNPKLAKRQNDKNNDVSRISSTHGQGIMNERRIGVISVNFRLSRVTCVASHQLTELMMLFCDLVSSSMK